MSVYSDFIHFVDGGSLVPYFIDGAKFYPLNFSYYERIEYDFKYYYYSHKGFFVGVGFSSMVRKISKKEYEMIKDSLVKKESLRVQLSFIFD